MDLLKFGPDKFQRVLGQGVENVIQEIEEIEKEQENNTWTKEEIESLTVKELRELAETEEVDLGIADLKQDIIDVLVEALTYTKGVAPCLEQLTV
jgi:predicted transcriptional regulator